MRQILVIISLLFIPIISFAQEIKGNVVDEFGTPLSGVTIQVLQTEKYSMTDFDGNFTIEAKQGQDLKFTMIGMQDLVAKATPNMSLVMKESLTQLDDIVMVGYGTRKKIDNTMAVLKAGQEELGKQKILNASQAIQGKLSGVQVTGTDSPGAQPTIIIRGVGSVSGKTSPIFVVDGIRMDDISNINTEDIESYEVLKDASALAIYGNQGANGVIIVTTKRGKGDKMQVNFDSYVGVRSPLKLVKMAGSNSYAYYTNTASGYTLFSQDQPVNTNWFDEVTRTVSYRNTNMNISGKSDKLGYYLGIGHYDEDGLLKGMNYNRTTINTKGDMQITDKLKVSTNLNVSFINDTPKPYSVFTTAYKQSPAVPVKFSNGQWGVPFVGDNGFVSTVGNSFNNVGNPVFELENYNEQSRSINMLGNINLDYKITSDLKLSTMFGGEHTNLRKYTFYNKLAAWLAADPSRTEEAYPYDSDQDSNYYNNSLTWYRDENYRWMANAYLTYNKVFADIHDIELMAGTEYVSRNNRKEMYVTVRDVPNESNYWSPNLAQSDYDEVFGKTYNTKNLTSYFARVQYKLMDKYLLTAMIRRDGSSQFQSDYRWGTFPSFGLGWVVSKEDFLKDSKFVNLLKIRGGYAELGNEDVELNSFNFSVNNDYNYGGGNSNQPGTTVTQAIQEDLSWEVTQLTNAGIDFELLDSKLSGSIDAYHKLNTNTIINVTPPGTAGLPDKTPAHVGEILNQGLEFMLRWEDKIGEDFSYYVAGTASFNKNELKSLNQNIVVSPITGGGLGNGQYTKVVNEDAVGQPVGSFWLWEYAGIGDNGEMLYYTKDGDKVTQDMLSNDDRKFMGSAMPKATYSFSLGFKYKGFDFSTDLYAATGSKVYNGKKAQRFSGENIEYSLATDFWTASNLDASNPAPFNTVPYASSYYLESGDFLRVNSIVLGYTLPKFIKSVEKVRIYVNAVNPFITQKYSGYSPEISGGITDTMGVELNAYPTLRSFVFGANINF
jgi:TonB-linked SusC/RagA family outer membrane protein